MTGPQLKTPLPGPRAKALIERDARVVSTSYTRGYPFVMARGEGAIVEDVDGNRFLDCAAGIAVASTGHSHPQVVAAIVDQAQKFLASHLRESEAMPFYVLVKRYAAAHAPRKAVEPEPAPRADQPDAPRPRRLALPVMFEPVPARRQLVLLR